MYLLSIHNHIDCYASRQETCQIEKRKHCIVTECKYRLTTQLYVYGVSDTLMHKCCHKLLRTTNSAVLIQFQG